MYGITDETRYRLYPAKAAGRVDIITGYLALAMVFLSRHKDELLVFLSKLDCGNALIPSHIEADEGKWENYQSSERNYRNVFIAILFHSRTSLPHIVTEYGVIVVFTH